MSDINRNQLKQTLLVTLILLLVLFVGIQAWYMAGMKKQLEVIQTQQTSAPLASMDTMAKEKLTIKPENVVAVSNDQQSPPQEGQKAKPEQKGNKNVKPLFDDDIFNTPFDARTWNPYEEIQRMQRDMDRMFNNTFDRFNSSPDFQHLFRYGISTPEIDVREDDSQYTVIVNLPGTDESDISVKLDGQKLTIKGEQNYEKQNKDAMGNMIFRERRSGAFQRSITLPEPVRQNEMKTQVENGVLTITIPKEIQPV